MLIYLASALTAAISLPWRGTLDSMSHMDYVYQIHHSRLPEPFGPLYREVNPRASKDPRWSTQMHLSAHHPPLFYLIASVPIGSLLDAGKWERAVWRGRLLNVGIGFLCVLALAWAGWRLGGEDRARLTIALPVIAGTSAMFIRFAGDIYNDLLATLFSILAVALSCLMVREGYRRRIFLMLALVCALGMATRSTCVFALIVAMGSVFLAVYWDRDRPVGQRLLRATGLSAVLAIVAILPIFWFYLGNYRWSGSWYLASPKMQIQGRPESTVSEVLSNEGYWLLMPKNLLGTQWIAPWHNQQWSLWLAALCALAIVYLVTKRGGWKNALHLDRTALPWLVLMAHFAGLMFAQFTHKVGWGQLSFRYLFPALLSIGMFMAVPAAAWRRMSGVLVAGIGALMVFSGPMGQMHYLDRRYPQIAPGEGSWNRLLAVVAGNGFAVEWLWVAWSVVAACLLVLLWAVPRAVVVDAASDVPRR